MVQTLGDPNPRKPTHPLPRNPNPHNNNVSLQRLKSNRARWAFLNGRLRRGIQPLHTPTHAHLIRGWRCISVSGVSGAGGVRRTSPGSGFVSSFVTRSKFQIFHFRHKFCSGNRLPLRCHSQFGSLKGPLYCFV